MRQNFVRPFAIFIFDFQREIFGAKIINQDRAKSAIRIQKTEIFKNGCKFLGINLFLIMVKEDSPVTEVPDANAFAHEMEEEVDEDVGGVESWLERWNSGVADGNVGKRPGHQLVPVTLIPPASEGEE